MATQRYVSTSFWDDPWVCSTDPSEKLLYLYLMTGPLTNIAGVYELTIRRISFDTGFNSEMVQKILDRFSKDGKAYHFGNYIILPSWPKHQKWGQRAKIKQGIDNILEKLPKNVLSHMVSIGYQYDLNYLDLDLDSDLDSDIDLDSDMDIEAKPQGIKDKPRSQNSPLERIMKLWTVSGLPNCGMIFNLSTPNACIDGINGFGEDYVCEAVKNMAKHKAEIGQKYIPSFQSFMTNGKIGVWHDWRPGEKANVIELSEDERMDF